MINSQKFADRAAASTAAAKRIAAQLESRLQRDSTAALVVSGGSTPTDCFTELSKISLGWDRVRVVLSDERWVTAGDPDSNESLVRATLLVNAARKAQLLPVFDDDLTIEQRCEQLDAEIRALPAPFAVTLLGMGEDGHFASLFADADNLEQGLDADGALLCIPVATAASPLRRVSLTLAALARSDEILLLVFGEQKRQVFETALQARDSYPVAALLALEHPPITIYWAP
jgi:6-phosphogluconolactonase